MGLPPVYIDIVYSIYRLYTIYNRRIVPVGVRAGDVGSVGSDVAGEMEPLGKKLAISTRKYALAFTTHNSKFKIQAFPKFNSHKAFTDGRLSDGL